MIYAQIISIIAVVILGSFLIWDDIKLSWDALLDWSLDVLERCFEVKAMLFRGERFPFWLDCKGRVACLFLDFDAFLVRCRKYWQTVRAYYKNHQKARVVYDYRNSFFQRRPCYYQLWFRRWWTVPEFVYRLYCWQRVERNHRAAMKLRAERRW